MISARREAAALQFALESKRDPYQIFSGLFHIQTNMSLNTTPNMMTNAITKSVPTATILFNIALHSFVAPALENSLTT